MAAPALSSADLEPTRPALTDDEVAAIARAKRVSLIDYMKQYLSEQPKRRVKVRNDGDVFVQINGYSILIQAGVPVDVPEPVAHLLEQADYI